MLETELTLVALVHMAVYNKARLDCSELKRFDELDIVGHAMHRALERVLLVFSIEKRIMSAQHNETLSHRGGR